MEFVFENKIIENISDLMTSSKVDSIQIRLSHTNEPVTEVDDQDQQNDD